MNLESTPLKEKRWLLAFSKKLFVGGLAIFVIAGIISTFLVSAIELSQQLRGKSEYNSLVAVRIALFMLDRDEEDAIPLSRQCPNGQSMNWRIHLIPSLVDVLPDSEQNRQRLEMYRILCQQENPAPEDFSSTIPLVPGMPLDLNVYAITYDGMHLSPTGLDDYDKNRDNPIIAVAAIRRHSSWMDNTDILVDTQTGRLTLFCADGEIEEIDIRGRCAIRKDGTIRRIPKTIPKQDILGHLRSDRL